MKKLWIVAWGIITVMADARAATPTLSPSASSSSVVVTKKERLNHAITRIKAKAEAERGRMRIKARAAVRKAARKRRAAAIAAGPAPTAATTASVANLTARKASGKTRGKTPKKTASKTRKPAPPSTRKLVAATVAPSTAWASTALASTIPVTPPIPDSRVAASGFAPVPPAAAPAAPAMPATAAPRNKGIPPGFEEWFAPQKTAVDLYYGGRFLMTTLVEYTLDKITFLNPPEVAARVPGLRSAPEFSILLAAPLPTHSDLVCIRPNQPLCGRLEPADVGVIFDETRFRADLFVQPTLLLEAQRLSDQYLPEPVHPHATLVQGLNALYAGSSEGTNRFSLFGRTRLGQGRGHGFANWVSTDENALSVDELGYRHDFKDIQVNAGLFEPAIDALRAMPRQPIMGVSVARSLLTRTDLDSVIASPIDLFIPVSGRVDIFRDGRLISTGFYEAGNRSIDTSRLPGGAYTIDIVITDVSGATRTVQQLFIKSSLMAPPGAPLWFVDAGRVMQRAPLENLPDELDATQLRAGYRWRQRQWLGFGTAAALTDNESLLELSAGLLFDWIEGGAELYGSSAGGSGFGLRGLARWKELVASINFQKTQADDPPQTPGQYRLLPTEQSLSALQLTHPLWQGLLTASISERLDPPDGKSIQRSTFGYTRTFPLRGYHSLQVQAEIGNEDGNALAMLTLQWRNIRGKWSDSAQLRLSQSDAGDNSNSVTAGVATTWRDGDRFVDDVELGLRAETGDQNQSLTLEGLHRSQYGRGSASLTTSSINGFGQTLSSLGYDTSLVMGANRKVAIGGGPNLNEAGVVLDLRSAPDTLFEVSTDGQPQFIARGGKMAALTLSPYHQYRVRLKDSGLALAQFDDHPREVTLYPGHVVNLDWAIQSVQVLIGRIVLADGQPLANARIEGAEGPALTDEEGFIQTEVSSNVRELVARQGNLECRIALPVLLPGQNVMRSKELHCEIGKDKDQPVATPD